MTVNVLEVAGSSAAVDPLTGGRLASLVIGGRERLLTKPAPSSLPAALRYGSYLMAPFIGRVANGRLEWGGVSADLERNEGRHAIHGTVYDEPWQVVESSASSIVLEHELNPRRWPFRGRLRQRYSLGATALVIEATLVAGDEMPAALGWHPWFTAEPDVCVEVQGDHVLVLGDDLIPTGALRDVDANTDLRGGRRVTEVHLDTVYVGVRSPLVVRWPDLELRMELGERVQTAVVYNAAGLVCVEPATAWPDAVRLSREGCRGTGLVTLRPGESLVARTRWSWHGIADRR